MQQVLESGAVETKNQKYSIKCKTNNSRTAEKHDDTQAFKDGKRLFLLEQQSKNDNSRATNNIKNTLKNTLTEMKSLTVKEVSKVYLKERK